LALIIIMHKGMNYIAPSLEFYIGYNGKFWSLWGYTFNICYDRQFF